MPICGRSWRSATPGTRIAIIVLTSSTDTIEKHIRLRNRPHEAAENMVRRFRLIDAEFRRLAPRYPNTVVINRDGKEFHDRDGLEYIIAAAGLPPFTEIPYNVRKRDRGFTDRGRIAESTLKAELSRSSGTNRTVAVRARRSFRLRRKISR